MSGNDSSRPNSCILKGRDLITAGIFTALYFAVNFVRMLLSGLHPHLWVFDAVTRCEAPSHWRASTPSATPHRLS